MKRAVAGLYRTYGKDFVLECRVEKNGNIVIETIEGIYIWCYGK